MTLRHVPVSAYRSAGRDISGTGIIRIAEVKARCEAGPGHI